MKNICLHLSERRMSDIWVRTAEFVFSQLLCNLHKDRSSRPDSRVAEDHSAEICDILFIYLYFFFFAAAAVVYIVFRREEVASRMGSPQEEACLQTCGRQSQHPHPASPLLIHLHLFLSDAAQRSVTLHNARQSAQEIT